MLIFDVFKFYKNGHGIINYKLAPEVKVGDEIFFKLFIKGFDDDSNLSSSIYGLIYDIALFSKVPGLLSILGAILIFASVILFSIVQFFQ